MSTQITIDTSEVDAFVAHLQGVSGRVLPAVTPVFKRAAQNIKTDTQADMRASSNRGFQAIARHVSYDEPTVSGATLKTEVGIDKGGAGNLGNIAVFGTYKGGGTRKHPSEHAAKEMPEFERQILIAVEGLI